MVGKEPTDEGPVVAGDVRLSFDDEHNGAEFRDIEDEDGLQVGSPMTWDTDAPGGMVSLSSVDKHFGDGEVGGGCMVLLMVAMLFYLCDMVLSYVSIGSFFKHCDAWVGLTPLILAAAADISMFLFGKLLKSQSIFLWPMNFKILLLTPIYELQWMARVFIEWKRHVSDSATATKHFPRFLHAFGGMLCLLRVFVFTLPQMLYLILARVSLNDTTVHENVPTTSVYYVSLAAHCIFCFMTLLVLLQVCTHVHPQAKQAGVAASSSLTSILGTPIIYPSRFPATTIGIAILVIASYTAALLVSSLGVRARHCL